MSYEEMLMVTQYYLHSLEAKAFYRFIRKLAPDNRTAQDLFFQNLGGRYAFSTWQEDVIKYVARPTSNRQFRKELLLYYVVADVPVAQIIRSLNVSQASVYALKKKNPHDIVRRSAIEGFFVDHPDVIFSLRGLLQYCHLMDGYTVIKY